MGRMLKSNLFATSLTHIIATEVIHGWPTGDTLQTEIDNDCETVHDQHINTAGEPLHSTSESISEQAGPRIENWNWWELRLETEHVESHNIKLKYVLSFGSSNSRTPVNSDPNTYERSF